MAVYGNNIWMEVKVEMDATIDRFGKRKRLQLKSINLHYNFNHYDRRIIHKRYVDGY